MNSSSCMLQSTRSIQLCHSPTPCCITQLAAPVRRGTQHLLVVCHANQPSNLAMESLEKALQTINKIIHESEQRRHRAKASAGAAGSTATEDAGPGKLVSFSARASASKPVKVRPQRAGSQQLMHAVLPTLLQI